MGGNLPQTRGENEPIRENNRKREELTAHAKVQYQEEMTKYESDMEKYRQDAEAARMLPEEATPPVLTQPQRPKSIDVRLVEINNQYPHQEEKPLHLKPVPPPDMFHYIELRNLLTEKLQKMDVAEERMESVFVERLQKMQSDASAASGEIRPLI